MKVIKLFNRKLGLVDEVLLGYGSSEDEIKSEWFEKYGFINPARAKKFYTIIGDDGLINPFTVPTKLNWCKYDLFIYGKKIKSIVTKERNREDVLKELLSLAKYKASVKAVKYFLSFEIYLTENGIKSLLINSKSDKQFINFLYEDSRQA